MTKQKLSDEYLDEFRKDDLMRFKWLAEECKTWDEVITNLEERIEVIKVLKAEGYEIGQNEDDYLFYQKNPKKGELK